MILGLGLTVGKTSSTVEPGPPTIVLSQDPAPRAVVALGGAVALVVRAGVPNVLGLSDADARTTIAAAGVPLDHEDTQESPGPVGIVLSQTPAPGTAVTPSHEGGARRSRSRRASQCRTWSGACSPTRRRARPARPRARRHGQAGERQPGGLDPVAGPGARNACRPRHDGERHDRGGPAEADDRPEPRRHDRRQREGRSYHRPASSST